MRSGKILAVVMLVIGLSACVSREQSATNSYVSDQAGPGQARGRDTVGKGGPTGMQGAAGPAGERGPAGMQGAAGQAGARGEPGQRGAPGEKGERGRPGEPGDKGEKGGRGEPGTQGERGEPGEKGEPGAPGRDASPGALTVPVPIVLPWLIGQRQSDAMKPGSPDAEVAVEEGGWKPFVYYLLTGLAGFITALSPVLLALLQKENDDLKSRSSPDVQVPDKERRRIERLTILTVVLALLAGGWFFAYLALQFMQLLLVFICAYTLVVALSFLCYAWSRRLLGDVDSRTRIAQLKMDGKSKRYEHERAMAQLEIDAKSKQYEHERAMADEHRKMALRPMAQRAQRARENSGLPKSSASVKRNFKDLL